MGLGHAQSGGYFSLGTGGLWSPSGSHPRAFTWFSGLGLPT